jgi:hypothetical protein
MAIVAWATIAVAAKPDASTGLPCSSHWRDRSSFCADEGLAFEAGSAALAAWIAAQNTASKKRWQTCRAKSPTQTASWIFYAKAFDASCGHPPATALTRQWPQERRCGTRAARAANEWQVDTDPHHSDRVCHQGCLYENGFVSDEAGSYNQYRPTGDVCQPSAAHPVPRPSSP